MEFTNETKILAGVLAVTILIIVAGAFVAGRNDEIVEQPIDNTERLVRADDPVLGPNDAVVTVVEFGDFQCPACGAVHPVLSQIKELNKNNSVRFVYRQLPLNSIHPFAQKAAEASLAAQAQGKFWEYHDILFTNQRALARADLERYAQELGLNMDQFNTALDEDTYKEAVTQDSGDAQAVGARSTPTFFINGIKYNDPVSVNGLQNVINTALTGS